MMKKIIGILILTVFFSENYLIAQCFTTINSGSYHVTGKKSDGTFWIWGAGEFGQMGNSNLQNEAFPISFSSSNNWLEVKAGYINTFGIKLNGTLWGTGSNISGSLGIGNTQEYLSSLTQIGTANNWKSIAPSNFFTVALKTDNTIWAWGQNDGSQMGNGSCCNDQLSPIQVSTDTDWKMIATSQGRSAFALKNNGTLWCWGTNLFALLADNTVSERQYPTQHNPDTDWQTISLSYAHILALKTNGTLWSWGGGSNGETGDGLPANYNRFEPLQIGTASNWKTIYAGYNTSFAIKTDGTLWAWGKNNVGQLGDGTTTNQPFPVQIGTATDWKSVTGGYEYTLALKNDGSLWGWGNNLYGQLGNGTTVNEAVPVLIPVTGCVLGNDSFSRDEMELELIPNPAKSKVGITYNSSTSPELIVYDLLGKEVTHFNPTENKGVWQLNTSAFASGVYVVVMKNEKGILMQKKLMVE